MKQKIKFLLIRLKFIPLDNWGYFETIDGGITFNALSLFDTRYQIYFKGEIYESTIWINDKYYDIPFTNKKIYKFLNCLKTKLDNYSYLKNENRTYFSR